MTVNLNSFSIIGYPKTGNTWVHHVLVKALGVGWGDIFHTHGMDDDDINQKMSSEILFDFTEHLLKEKVLVLLRHPGDVLVSFYMHNVFREAIPLFHGKVDDIVMDPIYGIEKYMIFHNKLAESIYDKSVDVYIVWYEDLVSDPSLFKDIASFIGFNDDKKITDAVLFSSFENMKERERNGQYTIPTLERSPNWMLTENSFKVRAGLSGKYIDYFSRENIGIIRKKMKSLPSIFLNAYSWIIE